MANDKTNQHSPMGDKFLHQLRKLGEKHYGNQLYGEHLPYQHDLQRLIEAHIAEHYYTKDEVIKMVGEDYSCSTCDRLIQPTREWCCENCDAIFHEGCEGYSYSGEGEYPDESAYALCKKCYKPDPSKGYDITHKEGLL